MSIFKENDGLTYAARKILGADYESFASFFLRLISDCSKMEQSDQTNFFFVAFLTRRCHVLLEIFLEIFRSFLVDKEPAGTLSRFIEDMDFQQIERIVGEHFLTDSNLITQAGGIADVYLKTGKFPKVIVLDEIILHGRAVNSLLLMYETAVIKRIEQFNSDMSESKRDFLVDCLAHHTELRIYAQNDEPLLLLSRYRRQLHYDRLYGPAQIRELSQKCASLILNSDINNVAFSWNFKIPSCSMEQWKNIQHPSDFVQVNTNMKYIPQTCFFWLYPNASSPKAICTLRWKYSYTSPRNILAVPFIIFDRVPRQNLLRLHKRICEDLKNCEIGFLTSYEDRGLGSPDSCYLRWVSETNDLVLAYLMFRRFCKEGDAGMWAQHLQLAMLNRNYKLFSSAGLRYEEISSDLKKIWSWKPERPDQLEQYFEILLEDAQPLWNKEYFSGVPGVISITDQSYANKQMLQAVEDAIASIGYEAEQNACEKYSSGIFFSDEILADWGKRYSMSETVSRCEQILKKSNRDKPEDLYAILALIVQAMDIGIIGMNPQYEKHSDTLYTMVRAGEHSLFIKPSRYQDYIPVLVEISRRCRESQLDLHTEVQRFIESLPDHNRDVTASELNRFLDDLRRSSQRIEDWDFRLFDQINIHSRRHHQRARTALNKRLFRQNHLLEAYREI